MQINILFFGKLIDLIGSSKITIDDVNDTNSLINKLQQQYPSLGESKYIIAVDKIIISENTKLKDLCTVALLPPFSGG